MLRAVKVFRDELSPFFVTYYKMIQLKKNLYVHIENILYKIHSKY